LLRNCSQWQVRNAQRHFIQGNKSKGRHHAGQRKSNYLRWKDKRDVYVLTNTHTPPVEGNFCDESGRAVKPSVITNYNAHMGYVDKSDRMANSYGITRTWKWIKKLFFHLTGMAILNAFLLHKTCGGKMTKRSGRISFVCWLRNPTSKMWMQVAYLEGDQVHLYLK